MFRRKWPRYRDSESLAFRSHTRCLDARAPSLRATAKRSRLSLSSDLLIPGLRVEGSDRRNSGSRQLVVQKMGFATVDR